MAVGDLGQLTVRIATDSKELKKGLKESQRRLKGFRSETKEASQKNQTFFKQLQSGWIQACLLYTSPSPRDRQRSRMPSSA